MNGGLGPQQSSVLQKALVSASVFLKAFSAEMMMMKMMIINELTVNVTDRNTGMEVCQERKRKEDRGEHFRQYFCLPSLMC